MTLIPPSSKLRQQILIAWIVIAAAIAFLTLRNVGRDETKSEDALIKRIQMRMRAFLAVELKRRGADQQQKQLTEDLERDARTPEDKLRVAIIVAELTGGEEGLKKLSLLTGDAGSPDLKGDIDAVRTIYEYGAASLDATQRDGLMRRHGFLGQLALAYGVSPDVEPRKTLLHTTLNFVVFAGLLALGLVLLMALSLVSLGAFVVFSIKGRLSRSYIPAPASSIFLQGFAAYLILFLGVGLMARILGWTSLQWNWLGLLIVPMLMFWIAQRGVSAEARQHAFGWHQGAGWRREVAAGVIGYVAGLVVIALGILMTYGLSVYAGTRAVHPAINILGGSTWQVLGLYGIACVLAPVLEETMFRGLLFHHLRGRWGWTISAGIVSLIFAVIHPQGWVAVPALTAIALVLAALREWRGSIIAPVVAHACNNFLAISLALTLARWN